MIKMNNKGVITRGMALLALLNGAEKLKDNSVAYYAEDSNKVAIRKEPES